MNAVSDYQTHVFTSTYTADVSGVCSALYELGGMTVIHDPSGCNSTYSTHDEPRWFDTDSLMFVSGLDEMTAVLGDDNVLIDDVTHAVRDLKPRFVTLCSGSIPHIIAFDCKGVAHLLEKRTGSHYGKPFLRGRCGRRPDGMGETLRRPVGKPVSRRLFGQPGLLRKYFRGRCRPGILLGEPAGRNAPGFLH